MNGDVTTSAQITRQLDKAIVFSLLGMVVAIPLSESLKSILFGLSLTCWLVKLVITKNFSVQIPPIGWAFLTWLSAIFVSSLFSTCGFFVGVRDVLLYTIFFFLLVNTIHSRDQVWMVIWAVIIGIGLGEVLALYEYLIAKEYVFSGRDMTRLHIGSLGFTGAYLAMIFALLFGLWSHIRFASKPQTFLIAVSLLSGLALLFTYTRTMWIVVLIIAALCALLHRQWWPIGGGALIIASLVVGMITSPWISNRIMVLANPLTAPSFVSRFPIWDAAMRMFHEYPLLGVGHKCFKPNREQFGVPENIGQAHNLFFHVAAELGSLGIIALVVWVGAYIYFLYQTRKQMLDPLSRSLWFATMGSFVTILIGGIIDPMIGSEVSLLFMLVTGLLIVSQRLAAEKQT